VIASVSTPPAGEHVLLDALTLEPAGGVKQANRRDVPKGRTRSCLTEFVNPERARGRISDIYERCTSLRTGIVNHSGEGDHDRPKAHPLGGQVSFASLHGSPAVICQVRGSVRFRALAQPSRKSRSSRSHSARHP